MTANLSFGIKNPMTKGIETFYTDLHSAMYDLGEIDQAPFPTALEFREFIKRYYPQGMMGMACLDAGCGGTAVNTYSMAIAGSNSITAIDINQKSLDIASVALKKLGITRISFQFASLLSLPFSESQFDFIVCSGVIHHTPNPEHALRELFRVAKPGATVYCSVYCFEKSWIFWAVQLWRFLSWLIPFQLMYSLFKGNVTINNFVLDHMYVPILWVYREADFRLLLEQTGFQIQDSFCRAMDSLVGRSFLGRSLSGDGLLRVFICKK